MVTIQGLILIVIVQISYGCSYPCGDAPQGCLSTDPAKCLSCQSNRNYYNFGCFQCAYPCATCRKTAQTCLSCQDSRYYYQNACVLCAYPCQTCVQIPLKCSSCQNGKILQCGSCVTAINTTPQTCTTGYYYENGNCCVCLSECASCTAINNCQTCQAGYYLQNSSCQPCSDAILGCITCLSANTCTSCVDILTMNTYDGMLTSNWSCVNGIVQQAYPCSNTYPIYNTCTVAGQGCTGSSPTYVASGCTTQLLCEVPCSACATTSTNCTACVSPLTLSSGTCVCPTSYYLTGTFTCQACTSPCSNCITSDTNCTACIANYDLSSNTCICGTGGYISGGSCLPCTSPCSTCVTTATNCTACVNNYTLSSNTCTCPGGFYISSTQCFACNSNCQTCITTATTCTACNTDFVLQTSTCVCNPTSPCLTCLTGPTVCLSCIPGTHLWNNQCLPCTSPCSQCSSSGTTCTACITDFALSLNTCTCAAQSPCQSCSTGPTVCLTCIASHYLSSTQCLPCQSPCSQCQTSNTYCTACITNFNLSANTCTCAPLGYCFTCVTAPTVCTSCSNGYYLSSSQCLECTSPCSQCQNTATECTQCISNFTISGNTCTCNPQTPCATCSTGPTACTSCQSGYYLHTSSCLQCYAICTQCSTSSTNCSQCVSNATLTGNTCSCNVGYFLSGITCVQCTSPCSECTTSATHCTHCITNFTLTSNQCNCNPQAPCQTCSTGPTVCASCGVTQYLSGTTCQQCTRPCSNCQTSSTHCLTCIAYASIFSANTCTCINGYVFVSNSCLPCTSPCAYCSTDQTTCTACITNFVLSNNTCDCNAASPCLTCDTSPTHCTACTDNTNMTLDNFTCRCPSSMFNLSGTCQDCDPNCLTCITNATHCQICDSAFYLTTSYTCIQCSLPCLSCLTSATNCTTCIAGYNLNVNNCVLTCTANCSTCQTTPSNCISCFIGYFLNSNQCDLCSTNCQTCINTATQCVTCSPGYSLDSNQACYKCLDSCATCANSTSCLTCQGQYMTAINGICVCQDGYFQFQSVCKACNSNCLTCITQATHCLTCQSGYLSSTNTCISCQFPCLTCTSGTICNSCAVIYNLTLHNNQCICQEGSYWDQGVQSCQQCSPTCQTCITSTSCLTCYSIQFRILTTAECVCKNGYFAEEGVEICQICNDSTSAKSAQSCNHADCTDNIWTYGEECDNGSIYKGGCQNCLIQPQFICVNVILQASVCYQCPTNCNTCSIVDTNLQCSECLSGYSLINNICVQCADVCATCSGTINNCTTCKYQTTLSQCSLCTQMVGYYVDQNNKCITKCGDGIRAQTEQCDDGNQLNGDGCSKQCFIEDGYYLDEFSGLLYKINYPIPILKEDQNYTNIFQNIRQYYLTYSISLQSNTFNTSNIQISVGNKILNLDYKYNSLNNNSDDTNSVLVVISLNLSSTFTSEVLIIQFLDLLQILSSEGIQQQIKELEVGISDFIFVSASEKEQVESVSSYNTYLLYLIMALVILGVLLGGLEMFYNLLDILQLVSYLQYINTQFPYNLNTYLNLFQFAQFQYLQQYVNIQSYYTQFILEPDKSGPSKIIEDGYDNLLIVNCTIIVSAWISFLGIYYFALFMMWSMKEIQIIIKETDSPFTIKMKLIIYMIKGYLIQSCSAIANTFFYSGFLRTHYSTAYDYCLIVFLNISVFQLYTNNYSIMISQLLAIIFLIIYIAIIYLTAKLANRDKSEFKLKSFENRFGTIFIGIRQNQSCLQFNVINLTRKCMFMFSLVLCYSVPILQISNIILFSVLYIYYLIQCDPLIEEYEKRKQLISEILGLNFEFLLLLLVCDDNLKFLSLGDRSVIGWISIVDITLLILIQAGLDIRQQWNVYVKYYNRFKDFISRFLNNGSIQKDLKMPYQI